jgi:hypothetical protein
MRAFNHIVFSVLFVVSLVPAVFAESTPSGWQKAWPNTDFSKTSVPFSEIMSGGVNKDMIRSIDAPTFSPVSSITSLAPNEPVVSLKLGGVARAYPIRVLTRREIVNDVIGGVPVLITFCPLCNAAIAFDRRVDDEVLEFGTSGKLRHSDLVMYDRTTESWWQQFTGEAIVGELTGQKLKMLPVRLESWAWFKTRFPGGEVLDPRPPESPLEAYGENPYVKYDSSKKPFLYEGSLPKDIPSMARVVVVGGHAWPLSRLSELKEIMHEDIRLTWGPGQASALDTKAIWKGRDVGNVVVQRQEEGAWTDAVHDVTFAFVFHAFHPEGVWHLN